MSLIEDNNFLNLLVEAVTTIPLNGRLSIAGLQYLLFCTYEKETPFTTPEYEVFRYYQIENSIQVESEPITDHQKVAKELEPWLNLSISDEFKIKYWLIPLIAAIMFELAFGSKLIIIIEDNGKVVYALNELDDLWRSVELK
ncbi:hypothetical protein C1646_768478 [Rhizophagus diaphanus]|nr:hypothetical protein C1646_768478 [Rhizophagus diaphanus] [Rhizophagus sp. MUCL 43196]